MRWSSIFLPFSLLATSVLAAEPASKQFQEFHKKALASAPIKLDDASYKKVTALPRDYSVAVLLTAMDNRYACQMCREFGPEWDLLASSWTKGDKQGDSRVIFSTLDFNDGRDTFMSVSIAAVQLTVLESQYLTPCPAIARPANCACPLVLPAHHWRVRRYRDRASTIRFQHGVRTSSTISYS